VIITKKKCGHWQAKWSINNDFWKHKGFECKSLNFIEQKKELPDKQLLLIGIQQY
jgi:hypothetical protein